MNAEMLLQSNPLNVWSIYHYTPPRVGHSSSNTHSFAQSQSQIHIHSSFSSSKLYPKSMMTSSSSSSSVMRKLDVVSPVPSDIDIANSVQPIHISEIANHLNLTPNHYDLYGKYKAKVSSSSSYADSYICFYFLFFIIIIMCRFCYPLLMNCKNQKMGIMLWLEALLQLLLVKANLLLLLVSVKH